MYSMSFDQKSYIKKFNKNTYKMYQFRVKKSNKRLISFLDNIKNRNNYISQLLEDKCNVLTIKEIKQLSKPVFNKYGITEIYLFGSYARGEATNNSDVDFYCERGNLRFLTDLVDIMEDLERVLGKKVDIVFNDSRMEDNFRKSMFDDLIKLC